ncbi:WbqC family protein [Lysinibacillus sp. NPDC094403]|uniref:WbqC family protein n=1 Tax=Lysinibacillus sp. NPDC094403 TaxID=3390581 RepID=UPI003D04560C
MRVAIMQPYFFPYIGYFSLLQAADMFVILDTVQFQRKSWMMRNKIITSKGSDSTYIKLPVKKAPLNTLINQIVINNEVDWKTALFNQLLVYKKAPFYNETINLVNSILYEDTKKLVDVNKNILLGISNYLGLDCEIVVFSEMNITVEEINSADEWALNISKALNATEYINPPGGVSFFNKEKYKDNNIELKFIKNKLKQYNQFHFNFIPGLSIIDVMMFNSIEEIHKMLADYDVI